MFALVYPSMFNDVLAVEITIEIRSGFWIPSPLLREQNAIAIAEPIASANAAPVPHIKDFVVTAVLPCINNCVVAATASQGALVRTICN